MILLYNLGIRLYYVIVAIVSLFNKKAKLWIAGRKNVFEQIESKINRDDKILWFHSSSLGEFEQGRPVMEKIKEKYPEYKIFLTFYSPSGYEIRKNYAFADYIYYLPLDTKRNAIRLIKLIKPEIAFFIKYDFWYHYLNTLKKNKIPTYIFSTVFYKKQLFFKSYGGWYRKMLQVFEHIFVQTLDSKSLLSSININNTTIAGDTRFDRVYEIAQSVKSIPLVEKFKNNKTVFIAGSSWMPDEELFIPYINSSDNDNLKFIVAPHEIKSENIDRIYKSINKKIVKYSEANESTIAEAEVLIIDNIGMLSSIYQYCDIAHIGGGFGTSIHNIQEPATFGMPIIIGSNYQKFQEAKDLIVEGGVFVVGTIQEEKVLIDRFINSAEELKIAKEITRNYIKKSCGASDKIVDAVFS